MDSYDISKILLPQINYTLTELSCQYWNSQSFSYRDTPRPDHGILFITRGKIEFVSNSETLTASSGDIVFLPKGSYYEAIMRPGFGDTVDYLVNFDADFPQSLPQTPKRIVHTSHHKYIDMFDRLIELQLSATLNDFCMKSLFFALLDNIVRDCKNESDSQTDLLRKAQALLSGADDMSVSEIAKVCGISVSGLRNLFAKTIGRSPVQYRIHLKIDRAKFLLESTDMSVYDIADTLNFYDEAYFCKIFKKHVGCSPKKYVMNKRI